MTAATRFQAAFSPKGLGGTMAELSRVLRTRMQSSNRACSSMLCVQQQITTCSGTVPGGGPQGLQKKTAVGGEPERAHIVFAHCRPLAGNTWATTGTRTRAQSSIWTHTCTGASAKELFHTCKHTWCRPPMTRMMRITATLAHEINHVAAKAMKGYTGRASHTNDLLTRPHITSQV